MLTLDEDHQETLKSGKIIGISETWRTDTLTCGPYFLSNFQLIQSPASRDHSIGRGSGGLVLFVRNDVQIINVIEINNMWIFAKVEIDKVTLIVGSVYIRPNLDANTVIDMLADSLEEIHNENPDVPIILGGISMQELGT